MTEVLVGLAALVAAAVGLRVGLRRRVAAERALSLLAVRRHGTYRLEGAWALATQRPVAEVDAGRARVRVECELSTEEPGAIFHARVGYVLGAGPIFELVPERTIVTIAKTVGVIITDVRIGDPAFDAAYLVRAAAPDRVAALLTPRARVLLLGRLRGAQVAADGRVVQIVAQDGVVDDETLEALVDLAGDLASHGEEWLASIAELPEARVVAASGPWDARTPPGVELPLVPRVRIQPAARGRRAVAEAWAPCGRGVLPFKVTISAAGVGGALPSGRLPPDAAPHIGAVGEATLAADGERVTLTWAELETDLSRLLAGARIVAAFARGGTGSVAYR